MSNSMRRRFAAHLRVVRSDGSIPVLGCQYAHPALNERYGETVIGERDPRIESDKIHVYEAISGDRICTAKLVRVNTSFFAKSGESSYIV